jgi:hypothetical protein
MFKTNLSNGQSRYSRSFLEKLTVMLASHDEIIRKARLDLPKTKQGNRSTEQMIEEEQPRVILSRMARHLGSV